MNTTILFKSDTSFSVDQIGLPLDSSVTLLDMTEVPVTPTPTTQIATIIDTIIDPSAQPPDYCLISNHKILKRNDFLFRHLGPTPKFFSFVLCRLFPVEVKTPNENENDDNPETFLGLTYNNLYFISPNEETVLFFLNIGKLKSFTLQNNTVFFNSMGNDNGNHYNLDEDRSPERPVPLHEQFSIQTKEAEEIYHLITRIVENNKQCNTTNQKLRTFPKYFPPLAPSSKCTLPPGIKILWEKENALTIEQRRMRYKCTKVIHTNEIESWESSWKNHSNIGVFPRRASKNKLPADSDLNRKVALTSHDIRTLEVDAIVIPHKRGLNCNSGIASVIQEAAGTLVFTECDLWTKADPPPQAGDVIVTRGYNLPAKYIFHCVGPFGSHTRTLKKSYRTMLKMLKNYNIRSIAIAAAFVGGRICPAAVTARCLLQVVREWLSYRNNRNQIDHIIFVTYVNETRKHFKRLIPDFFPIQMNHSLTLSTFFKKNPFSSTLRRLRSVSTVSDSTTLSKKNSTPFLKKHTRRRSGESIIRTKSMGNYYQHQHTVKKIDTLLKSTPPILPASPNYIVPPSQFYPKGIPVSSSNRGRLRSNSTSHPLSNSLSPKTSAESLFLGKSASPSVFEPGKIGTQSGIKKSLDISSKSVPSLILPNSFSNMSGIGQQIIRSDSIQSPPTQMSGFDQQNTFSHDNIQSPSSYSPTQSNYLNNKNNLISMFTNNNLHVPTDSTLLSKSLPAHNFFSNMPSAPADPYAYGTVPVPWAEKQQDLYVHEEGRKNQDNYPYQEGRNGQDIIQSSQCPKGTEVDSFQFHFSDDELESTPPTKQDIHISKMLLHPHYQKKPSFISKSLTNSPVVDNQPQFSLSKSFSSSLHISPQSPLPPSPLPPSPIIDSISSWLEGLRLGNYIQLFEEEEITPDSVVLLTDEDLKSLGVKLGARRLILEDIRKRINLQQVTEYFGNDTIPQNNCPSNQSDLYLDNVVPLKLLGEGVFGIVYEGLWGGTTPIAMKCLRTEEMYLGLVSEISLLASLRHPNVVQCFGVGVHNNINYMVTELCNGSVQTLLREDSEDILINTSANKRITLLDILGMAKGVCAGMLYLQNHKIIHRDLAARNILFKEQNNTYIVKVADFGLASFLPGDNSYLTLQDKFPTKWSPIEVLLYNRFSYKSDVWSFGVVLWELISRGCLPYPGMTNTETSEAVAQGYRMPPPADCPPEMYELMMECWSPVPEDRPSFETLYTKIDLHTRGCEKKKGLTPESEFDELYQDDWCGE